MKLSNGGKKGKVILKYLVKLNLISNGRKESS